ncbi:MAG: AAA family ATPase, partial [SAR324 cluster bacterium]|nr:AAA family ATPase [SAR324 cluster bacterium]
MNVQDYKLTKKVFENLKIVVYTGSSISTGQEVIVKCLANSFPSKKEIAQVKREKEIADLFDHPNLVKIIDLVEEDNNLYIVMPAQNLFPVKDLLSQGPLSLENTLKVILTCTVGLQQMHEKHVIHKDINPSNILVDNSQNIVQIADFSISSLVTYEKQSTTNLRELEGTLEYMSPEQTGRMNRTLDYRSDFYSLGITFFELLTGKRPFEAVDQMELIHSHIALQPPPASKLRKDIPPVLDDILAKLLAKCAEDRYQSAYGIKADLERCLDEIQNGGITQFPIAKKDEVGLFSIPEKLYGRDQQRSKLLSLYNSAAAGQAPIMMVVGSGGTGKSALINEVYKPITESKGFFISGKFNQFDANIPYSALTHALTSLIQILINEDDAIQKQWKSNILDAVKGDGGVLTELIPNLVDLIGPQPIPDKLGIQEQKNRFNLLFLSFINIFAAAAHPLVLFLDDLQWADLGSLELLQKIFGDPTLGHIFLIGAYRDNEVDSTHPLIKSLDELTQKGRQVSDLMLLPLSTPEVTQLIQDTFLCTSELALPLADLVEQKT